MKRLIYLFTFLMIAGTYAQEKDPIDKMEETKTTTIKTNKNGKVVETKVKETIKKEQVVKTVPEAGHKINQNRLDTPVKVTKIVQIDSDSDPFYDTENKVVYYNFNDEKFTFTSDAKGFIISSASNNSYGQARKSMNNHFYIMTIKEQPAIGYFDNDGNFVVEYYDANKDVMVIESYEMIDF